MLFSGLAVLYCYDHQYLMLHLFIGPSPDADLVISILLQSNIPSASGKPNAPQQQLPSGPAPTTSDLSGSTKFTQSRDRRTGKRKGADSMFKSQSSIYVVFHSLCLIYQYLLHGWKLHQPFLFSQWQNSVLNEDGDV